MLGTSLKIEDGVAGTHSVSTLRTSLSSSMRTIPPGHFQRRSQIHKIMGHVGLAASSAMVRPVILAIIFEAVALILFST